MFFLIGFGLIARLGFFECYLLYIFTYSKTYNKTSKKNSISQAGSFWASLVPKGQNLRTFFLA